MSSSDAFHKNIRKYQIYVAISGLTTLGPLCNLFYLSAEISFSQLSLIEVASLSVLVILEVPTGIFADLLGRKKSIALGCLLMGGEYLLIAAGYNFPIFILGALIGGVGISLESGADDAILYDSLKKLKREDEFQKYLGQSSALYKVSAALSGILGGYLYGISTTVAFYLFGVVLLGLALYSLTMTETVEPSQQACQQKVKRGLIKQLRQLALRSYCCLRGNKALAWMILLSGLLTTLMRAHQSILRTPILNDMFSDPSYLGMVAAVGIVLNSIVSWHAHQLLKLFNQERLLFYFALIVSVVFIAIGLLDGLIILVFVLVISVINALKSVFLSNYWHKHFYSRQRVTLMSFNSACQSFIGIFTLLGTGLLTDHVDLKSSSAAIGVFILTLSLLLLLLRFFNTRVSSIEPPIAEVTPQINPT